MPQSIPRYHKRHVASRKGIIPETFLDGTSPFGYAHIRSYYPRLVSVIGDVAKFACMLIKDEGDRILATHDIGPLFKTRSMLEGCVWNNNAVASRSLTARRDGAGFLWIVFDTDLNNTAGMIFLPAYTNRLQDSKHQYCMGCAVPYDNES